MLIDYWHFTRANFRFLAFGFLLTFLSSAGQTYFIGVFGPDIQAEFKLDTGSWGLIYMMGTLASALVINWSGMMIDRFSLRVVTVFSLVGLGMACLLMSWATTPLLLIIAIFMLRHFGQGLTSHTAVTSMARYHSLDRGKAIALVAIGFAFGEATLPLLAIFTIELWGWRHTFAGVSIIVFLSLFLVLWLLKGQNLINASHVAAIGATNDGKSDHSHYTRKKILSEARFYFILPAMILPSLIMTAVFFFPAEIAKSKGWSNLWFTGHYWIYSLTAVIVTVYSGVLIDRFSASRVVPIFLVPLGVSLSVLAFSDHHFIIWPFMLFMGASSGLYFTGLNALWPELYGTKHLGAIRSLTNAVMIFSSALGPALLGSLLNWQIDFSVIFLVLSITCLFATLILVYTLREVK